MTTRKDKPLSFRLNIRTDIKTLPHAGFLLWVKHGALVHLMMQSAMHSMTLDELSERFQTRVHACPPEDNLPLSHYLAHALLQLIPYRIILIDGLPLPIHTDVPLTLHFLRVPHPKRDAQLNSVWQQHGRIVGHAVSQDSPRTLPQVTAVSQLFTDPSTPIPPATVAYHLLRLTEAGLVSLSLQITSIEETAVQPSDKTM